MVVLILNNRSAAPTAYDKGDTTKCPGWLSQKIPSRGPAYEYWFKLWLDSGRDFAQLMMTECVRRRKRN
eukprot:12574509-Alexandrium_andersonii.AAC.1